MMPSELTVVIVAVPPSRTVMVSALFKMIPLLISPLEMIYGMSLFPQFKIVDFYMSSQKYITLFGKSQIMRGFPMPESDEKKQAAPWWPDMTGKELQDNFPFFAFSSVSIT